MKIYQGGQLRINSKILDPIDVLIFLLAFASPIINTILFITRRESESGQLAIAYIVVALGTILLLIKYHSRFLPMVTGRLLILLFLIGGSFLYTSLVFGNNNSWFMSEFKAFFAMATCTFSLSLLIFWTGKKDINLTMVFVLDVLFTVTLFLALIRSSGLTTGGLVLDSSGLLYQNIAYYSAHCIGLNVFLVSELQKKWKQTLIKKVFFLLLTLVQLFVCFMSGGRGGAVLSMVLLVYGFIIIYGTKNFYKIVLPVVIGAFIMAFVFPIIISVFGIDEHGLNRVLKLFERNSIDDVRSILFSGAMAAFYSSPILGNGIGSIFYIINSYSHNLIADILAETGIVGILVFIYLMFTFFKTSRRIFNKGSLYRFLVLLFICGFTMNLFSGYFWVNQLVWLPIICINICSKRDIIIS